MIIKIKRNLLTEILILNDKVACPGCGCTCPCEYNDCKECSPCKDH